MKHGTPGKMWGDFVMVRFFKLISYVSWLKKRKKKHGTGFQGREVHPMGPCISISHHCNNYFSWPQRKLDRRIFQLWAKPNLTVTWSTKHVIDGTTSSLMLAIWKKESWVRKHGQPTVILWLKFSWELTVKTMHD